MAKLKAGSTVGGKVITTQDYVDNRVKTPVPVNAKFTDTVTRASERVVTSRTEPSISAGDQWHRVR